MLKLTSRLISVMFWQVKGEKDSAGHRRVPSDGPMVSHSFSGTKSIIWVLTAVC